VLLLATALAFAQVQSVPDVRAASEQTLQASGLGGVDAWTGGGGAGGELRLGGWAQREGSRVTASGGYSGMVEVLPASPVPILDNHGFYGSVGIRRRVPVGIAGGVNSGLLGQTPWTELAVGPWVGKDSRLNGWNARLAPSVRSGGHTLTGGAVASLSAYRSFGPLSSGAILDARWFSADSLPDGAVDALGWVSAHGQSTIVELYGGVGTTANSASGDLLGGLAAPGATVFRSGMTATLVVAPRVGIRLDLGAESGVGSVTYTRFRGMIGLTMWGAREQRPDPLQVTDGGTRFAVHAPGAGRVNVIGAFTDWVPRPMEQSIDGWWVCVLDLPPGQYEYVYEVDGMIVMPPEAATFRPDGFGGANAVVVISE